MADREEHREMTVHEGVEQPLLRQRRSHPGRESPGGDQAWHYAMIWEQGGADGVVKDPMAVVADIFTSRALEAWRAESDTLAKLEDKPPTKAELSDIICERACYIMKGRRCGFDLGWRRGATDKCKILSIRLRNPGTIEQLADKMEIYMPVTPEAYQVKGLECPRMLPTLGQLLGLTKKAVDLAPLHLRFDPLHKKAFAEAARNRLHNAKEFLEQLVKDWQTPPPAEVSRRLRRELFLQDRRRQVMAVLIGRMQEEETARNQAKLKVLQGIFAWACEQLEEKDKDLQFQMRRLTDDAARLEARKKRWTDPRASLSLAELENAELYEEFNLLDILRIIDSRLGEFFNVARLEEHGFISAFFPMHDAKAVGMLSERWASLRPAGVFLQWPGDQHNDVVRAYFGEEVAFFFSWLSFQTRMLLLPATLAAVSKLRKLFLDDFTSKAYRGGFSVVMCVWACVATALYSQLSSSKSLAWGMKGYALKEAPRADYQPQLRSSWRTSAVRYLHWLVAVAFIAETIWAAGHITKFRADILREIKDQGEGQFIDLPFGLRISYRLSQKIGLYAISINIKLLNWGWGWLSPKFAALENWRTDSQAKYHNVKKHFLVKSVVYYYPFVYLAFIREHVEGCNRKTHNCEWEFRNNLISFFVVHIATVIGMVAFQSLSNWWYRRQKVKAAAELGNKLTDVEEQALRPPYPGDTDDYLELCISLGFVTMFSCVFPLMAILALLCNLVEMRVLAYRMVHVLRRPIPKGQEGIGAWLGIMHCITYLSCVVSVAMCVFFLYPLKQKLPEDKKFMVFALAEHALLVIIFVLSSWLPAESSTEFILESHESTKSTILSSDRVQVEAETGTEENLDDGASPQKVHPAGKE